MRDAMSKGWAGTKIDDDCSRGVRGLYHAGGLASAGGTECPVPSLLLLGEAPANSQKIHKKNMVSQKSSGTIKSQKDKAAIVFPAT